MRKNLTQPENTEQDKTGSPRGSEPVFLVIGLLRRSHGLKGDVIMDLYTDFPERLFPGKTVFIGDDHRPLVIREMRAGNKELIVRFEGYSDPESTADLRNQLVYVPTSEVPELPPGEYYHHQLIGLQVVNNSGESVGVLTKILETGANDVYVIISPDGKEILIPAVDDFIKEINLDRGQMRVSPPEWE